jgi:hypothetical protein
VVILFMFEIKRYKKTKLKMILFMIIYNMILIIAMVLDFALIVLFVFPTDISLFIGNLIDENPDIWKVTIISIT